MSALLVGVAFALVAIASAELVASYRMTTRARRLHEETRREIAVRRAPIVVGIADAVLVRHLARGVYRRAVGLAEDRPS